MTEPTDLRPGVEISSASDWKKTGDEPVVLAVPSGNTCLARAPGMQHFVKAGLVPNSLLPIIYRAMKSGTAPNMQEIEKDGEKVNDMISLVDNVVCRIVVEPRVHPLPPEEDVESEKYSPTFERDDELLYVDEVNPDDKAFIFQWACGGTSDLEQFRQQADELMGPAPGSNNVSVPTKRPGGAKKTSAKKSGQSRKR